VLTYRILIYVAKQGQLTSVNGLNTESTLVGHYVRLSQHPVITEKILLNNILN
jgi:hypothetical protein